jgi:hypothetical protein
MCPLLAPHFFSFLLQPLTVLMRQIRLAVCAFNQSIFLRCLCLAASAIKYNLKVIYLSNLSSTHVTNLFFNDNYNDT